MTNDYTAEDALLHVSARAQRMRANLELLQQNLPAEASPADAAAWAVERARELERVIDEHRAALDVYAASYSTGISVASVIDVGAGWRWEHVWHPSPQRNPTGTVRADIPLPEGGRGSIVAAAPGVLDVVRHTPPGGG